MRCLQPVAITGAGLVCAAGETLPETLRAFAEVGRTMAGPPPFPTNFSFPVFRSPLGTQEIAPLPAIYSRTVALAYRAALEALACAGIARESVPEMRFGLVVGTSVGASLDFFDFYQELSAGEAPDLAPIDRYVASNPGPALGHLLRCPGPVQTVTNACSSGADALGLGAAWIRSGICDAVLAGGADALSPISYAGFSALRLPSPDPCRPFDARRSGLTLGEGAGFLVLESESSRRARKVSARAFLAGYGTCTDAYHLTAPHPEGRGLLLAVRQAFAQARASWKDIAFINAHGTATETNDAAEGAFFRRCCPSIPFVATKGLTGHTLGAAGAMEAIFTLEHLKAGEIPPSPRFSEADPAIGTAPVSRSTPVRGRMALSQSLAFGGNNSVLIIARGDV